MSSAHASCLHRCHSTAPKENLVPCRRSRGPGALCLAQKMCSGDVGWINKLNKSLILLRRKTREGNWGDHTRQVTCPPATQQGSDDGLWIRAPALLLALFNLNLHRAFLFLWCHFILTTTMWLSSEVIKSKTIHGTHHSFMSQGAETTTLSSILERHLSTLRHMPTTWKMCVMLSTCYRHGKRLRGTGRPSLDHIAIKGQTCVIQTSPGLSLQLYLKALWFDGWFFFGGGCYLNKLHHLAGDTAPSPLDYKHDVWEPLSQHLALWLARNKPSKII